MIDIRTKRDIKEFPVLEEPKTYIYIMLNNVGKVKIGKTRNIQQRYTSLCGSNGQGNEIVKLCCSPSTYLYTLESRMHFVFRNYNIKNTEWFYDEKDPEGNKLFNKAVKELYLLFTSDGYKKCNGLRQMIHERKKIHDCSNISND